MTHDETALLSENGNQSYEALQQPEAIEETKDEESSLSLWEITAILSTAFSYGCVNSTLFLVTLPIECERIEKQHPMPKSVSLGIFVAIAGVTQLISPLFGMLSDTYKPPSNFELGQRMPYLAFGSLLGTFGLLGQYLFSEEKFWFCYAISFFFVMIGLTISYNMMIALIPDQVPSQQTGVANAILAFQLRIQNMYGLYLCIVITSTILTGLFAHERDAALNIERGVVTKVSEGGRRPRSERILLGPWKLFRTMVYDPLSSLDSASLCGVYDIKIAQNHSFFLVTVSRLFYYCGVSSETIVLVLSRCSPKLSNLLSFAPSMIYPVGIASDRLLGGRRKPFVYFACFILSGVMFAMIFASSMYQMHLLCIILGAGNGIYLTMETSLAVDALPHSRRAMRRDSNSSTSGGDAQLLGLWGIASFVGSTLGPLIGGPLLFIFGSEPEKLDEGQDYSILGYAIVLSLSASYFLLSALALQGVETHSVT
eukprot:scaffold22560_cov135-Cylindrotheca_fusiformis.AAC.2